MSSEQSLRDRMASLEQIVTRHVDVCTSERQHIKERQAEDRQWRDSVEVIVKKLGDKVDAIPMTVQTAINGALNEKIKAALNLRIKNWSIAANGGLGAAVIWLIGRLLQWW